MLAWFRKYFVGMRAAAAYSMSFTILSFVASFFTSVFIARALGPEERGVYGIIFIWTTSLAVLSTLSVGEFVGIRSARLQNDTNARMQILHTGARAQFYTALLMLPLVVGIFMFSMDKLGVDANPISIALTVACCVAASQNNILGNLHRINGEHLSFNLNRAAFPVIYLLTLILVLVRGGWTPSLYEILLSFLTATLGGFICNSTLGWKYIKATLGRLATISTQPSWSVLSSAKELLPLHLSIVLLFTAISFDRFIAGSVLDHQSFGFYAAACSIVQPLSLLFTITTKTLMVGDKQLFNVAGKKRRLFQYVWLSLAAGILLSLVAWPILSWITPLLLGNAFGPSQTMIPWLLIGFCLMPLRTTLAEFARVSGHRKGALLPDFLYIFTLATIAAVFSVEDAGVFFGLSMLVGNLVAIACAAWLLYSPLKPDN